MAMIPSNNLNLVEIVEKEQPTTTYKLDFTDTNFVVGKVDGLDAIKQAVYLILNTERYEEIIYSWNYGKEFSDLIGKEIDYCLPLIETRIKEALLQDNRIESVDNFQFNVLKNKVHVSFDVHSTYGTYTQESEVGV